MVVKIFFVPKVVPKKRKEENISPKKHSTKVTKRKNYDLNSFHRMYHFTSFQDKFGSLHSLLKIHFLGGFFLPRIVIAIV